MSPVWVSFVAACTALVASICGPAVALTAVRHQFRANVLSANRQKWIETLREKTAELISLVAAASHLRRSAPEEWRGAQGLLAADPAMLARLERLALARWNLRLLLNPTQPEHAKMVATVDQLFEELQRTPGSEEHVRILVNDVALAAQNVIRDTWRRVKLGR